MTDLPRVDREIIGELWTSCRAWDTCMEIVQRFPNRYAGHQEEVEARDFVAARCRDLGLDVRIEDFACRHWHPGHARLHVLDGAVGTVEVPCVNLPMNGTAHVEAAVVYVEEGTPAQFAAAGDAVRGRIVLVNSRCPGYTHRPRTCRREKYDQAVAACAAGFFLPGQPGLRG